MFDPPISQLRSEAFAGDSTGAVLLKYDMFNTASKVRSQKPLVAILPGVRDRDLCSLTFNSVALFERAAHWGMGAKAAHALPAWCSTVSAKEARFRGSMERHPYEGAQSCVDEEKVGVALCLFLASRWRATGSMLVDVKGWGDGTRAFGLAIQGKGWRPGIFLVPVYAPVVGKASLEKRELFRDRLSLVVSHASARFRLVMGGDLNGEVGPGKDDLWRHGLGPYGDDHGTKGGEELLSFCEQEGLVVAGSFTRQDNKATWFHLRCKNCALFGHFLVPSFQRRWVASSHTVHHVSTQRSRGGTTLGRPERFATAPWLEHTDHDPIEISLRMRKDWVAEAVGKQRESSRPDVVRLLGGLRHDGYVHRTWKRSPKRWFTYRERP